MCIYIYIYWVDLNPSRTHQPLQVPGKGPTFLHTQILIEYINLIWKSKKDTSFVLACPLGLLPWLLPARTSRSVSVMSRPRGALVVLPRPVLVLL